MNKAIEMHFSQTDFANLTPKQITCLPLLAVGMPASEVAKKTKVSAVQISEWKRDTYFMEALDTVRRNALHDAETALACLASDAVNVLRETLNNASNERTRFQAATYVLDRLGLAHPLQFTAAPSGDVNMNLLLAALGEPK